MDGPTSQRPAGESTTEGAWSCVMSSRLRTALVAAGLTAAAVAIPFGLRAYVRSSCRSFYEDAHVVGSIPGLDEGFVPQDLFYMDSYAMWLFSGYMNDGSASPLYKVRKGWSPQRLTVELPDGQIYDGHGAAVTTAGDYVFLTVSNGYAVFRASTIAQAGPNACVQAIAIVPVPLTPAFMIAQNNALYLGEFYEPFFYNTPRSHHVTTPDHTHNPALMLAYPAASNEAFGFARTPTRCFSIPARVQGMCLTDQGTRLVLSCSWGYGDAHLLAYDTSRFQTDGSLAIDGFDVPLTCLDGRSLVERLRVPPMAEGIDGHNGAVFLANEAASERYLIGRFYGGGVVYRLPI